MNLRRCLRTALVFILGHAAAKVSRTRSASAFFHALYFMLPLTRMVVTEFALFKGRGGISAGRTRRTRAHDIFQSLIALTVSGERLLRDEYES